MAKRLAFSFFTSLALALLFSEIADRVSALVYVGFIAAPGMLAAAILFPQGIHEAWPELYVAVAIILDAALYTWPLLIVWRLLAGRQKLNISDSEAAASGQSWSSRSNAGGRFCALGSSMLRLLAVPAGAIPFDVNHAEDCAQNDQNNK